MGFKDRLNLEKQFTFYASYHNQPVNVAIHLLCIWPLLITGLTLMQYTPDFVASPSWFTAVPFGNTARVNLAFAVSAVYVACYLVLEPVVGALGGAMVAAVYLFTGHLVQTRALIQEYPVWQVALAVHVVAWIVQFIGHGVFEKRAPALLDSLDQALLTAPLFVLMEIAFFLGYRKEFHAKIMNKVHANVAEFKAKSKKS